MCGILEDTTLFYTAGDIIMFLVFYKDHQLVDPPTYQTYAAIIPFTPQTKITCIPR